MPTTQVLQAAQDVLAARQQVEISAGALDQARQMVEVAKVQYDIGVISNLEYLDAQTALETSNVSNLARDVQGSPELSTRCARRSGRRSGVAPPAEDTTTR